MSSIYKLQSFYKLLSLLVQNAHADFRILVLGHKFFV